MAISKTKGPKGAMRPGMPTWADTGANAGRAGAQGGSGSGPKKEGPIGRRGSSGPFPKVARGTMGPNSAWDGSHKPKAVVQVSGAQGFGSGKPKADGRMEKLRGKT
jgi:hypothetical protein